jgi:apolipoprotein N-acyltransferase
MNKNFLLTFWQKCLYLIISFVVVAFGQPAWSESLSLLAAIGGFCLFWRVLLSLPGAKSRFFMGMGWFAAVQVEQLWWFSSHPYLYIYGVIIFCAMIMGAQFGFLSIWIKAQVLHRYSSLFALAGLWTLLEWSRLFIFSGLPFNPVGLTLSASLYPLQFASLGGVYGLSFWVILTNLFLLRAWVSPKSRVNWISVSAAVFIPYVFGWLHLAAHQPLKSETLSVVLVQPALPIEENLLFQTAEEARHFVLKEWQQALATLKQHVGQKVELIVFPEYLVPFGTFHPVFPLDEIEPLFSELFGKEFRLDSLDLQQKTLASNANIAQLLADHFQAHVVIGLEDSVMIDEEMRKAESYSAAFHFTPGRVLPERYEKLKLVPMGEYIPFKWCREIAACYGITGSFTCGKGAKVFSAPVPFGPSICYEEMYGYLMRQNRMKGAELLVNLTNDGWFPNSRLPKQHFDHARLRTVENGIPLVRACNTGITGAVDSLGQIIGVLGDDHMQMQQVGGSIRLDVPRYHYQTLYAQHGDLPILGLSALSILLGIFLSKKSKQESK